ncbi:peptidase m28 [Cellulophaga baltica]|uniref:Uncharacterized protein n=1 Tax=Cellulophaga baltica TaxID=76594 RepID=A0A1G7FNG2_9FLAO|nr:peptidase m28 [Cellulophaga baltica]WFO14955.1 peptidase m28 [Cellulophaga baltica 4]SDE77379.1 hypothetical protein SAMN04487992_103383 [Cellulophaga baltica]
MKTSRTFLLALAIVTLSLASCTNDTSENSDDNIYEQQAYERTEIKMGDV